MWQQPPPPPPIEQLSNCPQRYAKLHKIGEGTYAHVYCARDLETGALVALKDVFMSPDEGTPSTALREIAFLKALAGHPNIVLLEAVLHDEAGLTLVFEHADGGDLKQHIDAANRAGHGLSERQIAGLVRQLVEGVAACHRHQIVHRDLKPQNLLLFNKSLAGPILKLADFGLARTLGIPVPSYSSEVVTLWYRAPELLLGATLYGTAIDMWSVGCIAGEMLRGGAPLFPGQSGSDQLRRIFTTIGPPTVAEWQNLAPGHQPGNGDVGEAERGLLNGALLGCANVAPSGAAVDFCRRCLEYRPAARMTADEALAHPFLRLYPGNCL